ncbi:MAG TPA: S41 family peptidase [Patescibacteria group bacterium]|nr:S41 family peptidase [Patescibacteria group bacterium]
MFNAKRKSVHVVLFGVLALAIGFGGFLLGLHVAAGPSSAGGSRAVLGIGQMPPADMNFSKDVDFKQFWDLWQLIKEKYYEQPVNDKDLLYGAMSGLAESLNDPYTDFFSPKLASDFQQALAGKFEGIGAELGLKDGNMTIIAPLPDSPAAKAGLLAGDVIGKVNDQDVSGMTLEQVVSLIRGKKGTKVALTILRLSQKKPPFEVTITRDEIQVKSVTWKMLPGQVALITVTNFNTDTQQGFSNAVDAVLAKSPKGLIVDFRNNPGGFLDTALSMAGEWLGDGVVVKERRQGKIVETLHGNGRKRLQGMPTIVLVNEGSASAAEIVAGALQDTGAAKLLGTKTFGKGSVQDYESLSDGAAIKITIAEWLTPKERAINKIGLEPDILVDRTADDYEAGRDPQLDRALAILTGTATGTASNTTSTSAH